MNVNANEVHKIVKNPHKNARFPFELTFHVVLFLVSLSTAQLWISFDEATIIVTQLDGK
jgi:hypothetical protein